MANFIEITDNGSNLKEPLNLLVNLDLVTSIYPKVDGDGSVINLSTSKVIYTDMNYLSLKKIINDTQRKS